MEDPFFIYEVEVGDTITGVAAKIGYITPTQLAKINRISLTGCVFPPLFPGQRLIIPTQKSISGGLMKLRRAPGAALRVREPLNPSSRTSTGSEVSEDMFAVQPYYYTARVIRSSKRPEKQDEEVLESQLVKVVAQHILMPSQTCIDGILLITPDSLCFDADRTAKMQQLAHQLKCQAEQANRTSLDSLPPSVPFEADAESLHELCSESLLSLGICASLQSVIAMSTHSSLEEFSQLSPPFREVLRPRSATTPAVISAAEPLPKSCAAETDSSTQQPSTTASLSNTDSAASNSSTVEPPAVASLKNPVEPLHHTERLEHVIKDPVYLCLTIITEDETANSHPEAKDYYFRLSLTEVGRVYSFLLRAGVGTRGRRKYQADKTDMLHTCGKTSKEDVEEHRPSMVAEALLEMEKTPICLLLHGGDSDILDEQMLTELATNIPVQWTGCNLHLMYKTERDGYSLSNLYRKCKPRSGGMLLLLRDTTGTVFGALLSENIRCCKNFYGTGETCVFHWAPSFQRYDWSRKNYFFMRGEPEFFQVGGHSGRSAIWFDESLKYGRSESTETFDNPVLSGVPSIQLNSSLTANSRKTRISGDLGEELASKEEGPMSTSPLRKLLPPSDTSPFVIDALEVWKLTS